MRDLSKTKTLDSHGRLRRCDLRISKVANKYRQSLGSTLDLFILCIFLRCTKINNATNMSMLRSAAPKSNALISMLRSFFCESLKTRSL